jgi:hypothetical protein
VDFGTVVEWFLLCTGTERQLNVDLGQLLRVLVEFPMEAAVAAVRGLQLS